MLILRKTVIAGIVFGLFVSGASLAQAAELKEDTVVTPKGEPGDLVAPPYQNQDLKGNNNNLTFTTYEKGPYWDSIFVASSNDMNVSDIGALQIIDLNATKSPNDGSNDGFIRAEKKTKTHHQRSLAQNSI